MAYYVPGGGANLDEDGIVRRVSVTQATPNFFEVLGVRPQGGPGFVDATADPNIVVLSHRSWQRIFRGDPQIIGKSIRLNGRLYRVRAVAPRDAEYPAGTELWIGPLRRSLERARLLGREARPRSVARLSRRVSSAP